MANNLDLPNLFNPMMLWTDVGMRALDMTLSSSQNISEGLDRLTRAGADASVETIENAELPRAARRGRLDAHSPWALAAQVQQATFNLMTHAFEQWMKTVAALVSMGAGRSFGETVARQNPLLNAMRADIQWRGAEEIAAPGRPGSSSGPPGSRQRQTEAGAAEHAAARAEPKRRSRASLRAAKPKSRTRNGS